MPIWNADKNLVLFFYGEHYADKEEVDGSISGRHDATNSDASFVLRLFEEKGYSFLKYLNGWFHGILVDLKRNTIVLFNDRFGMQRLYSYEDGDTFLFASEAKAILAIRRELRSLDSRGVGEFLTCSCVLENRSLFQNLFALAGGSFLTFNHARLQKKDYYFKPEEWEGQPLLQKEEVYGRIKEVFVPALSRCLNSKLPIGISLTGGLDTRLIMAYLEEPLKKIPCYTFSGMHRESYDVKIARRVAAACGYRYEILSLGKDFLLSYPKLSEKAVYVSDGCLGAGGAYELYFNRLARQLADVRITGNYGSETFRGVRQLVASRPHRQLIHPDYSKYITQAMATFNDIHRCHDLSYGIFRQAPWLGYGRMAVEQSQVIVRTPFMDNEFLGFMYRVPQSLRADSDLELHLIEQGYPGLLEIPTDRAERGRYGKMSSPWAHIWIRFLFKADYCYKSGMPQWLELIHFLLGPLRPEKLIIGRHRFHFYRIWFRNELAAHVKDVLLDPSTAKRPYLNGPFLEKMVSHHIRGDRNYTDQIEQVLTLELIQKLFIEQT
jgi:asparagine synthase (glutamine-hydrolysing)